MSELEISLQGGHHDVKVVKVKLVKVGFALWLLQLQLKKHGVEGGRFTD